MPDTDPPNPLAVVARAAYLRAGGLDWPAVAERLARPRADAEALAAHPAWAGLYRLAARAAAREAEADARYERRRALRSPDEGEATAAAEETYKLRKQRPGGAKPPAPTDRDRLVRAYLECLNAMSVEEYLAHDPPPSAGPNVTPP